MVISAEKDYNMSINSHRRCIMPEITDFADIYQEIARETNPETAAQIHRLFKGQQIIFPKKLYNREYIYRYIHQHYNGRNVRELSMMFEYSDRRVRQIIKITDI